jgi:hypothetical protein
VGGYLSGFGLWVGLWEAREGRSRRRRCPAARFDAANAPFKLLGEVVCEASPATVVTEPGLLAQSNHLEPEAVCEANEAAGIFELPNHFSPVPILLGQRW